MQVAFQNVSFEKGGAAILTDLTFSTGETPIFLVFGESGAGKTSLLRLVNRLAEPTAGEVFVGDRTVGAYPPTKLRTMVGMIFQEPRLLPGTVAHNIALPAGYHGLEPDVPQLLDRVGLPGTANRDVRDLSGGEAQRVSIARALSVGPSVLLMDEPTSSLDEPAAVRIEELLKGLVAEENLRVIFVTHDRGQIARLGGQGIVLARGRLVHAGGIPRHLAEPSGAGETGTPRPSLSAETGPS